MGYLKILNKEPIDMLKNTCKETARPFEIEIYTCSVDRSKDASNINLFSIVI
jgi:hypothetical protein